MESVSSLVLWGQSMPSEVMWLVMLLVAFGGLLLMHFLLGEVGLYGVIVLAVVGANVQVLKVVSFGLMGGEPVALGTVLFATTFLATDILCERYGARSALRGVLMGFVGFFVWVVWMNVTIAFPPYVASEGEQVYQAHESIEVLFKVLPQFFVASMVSFLVSEILDVWIFEGLRRKMLGRRLWLRNNVSTIMSSLVDSTIFSILAWVVLNPDPFPLETVIVTYILGTFGLRVLVAFLDTPIVYIACVMPVLGERVRREGV
jgi:hypothetical protein